MWLSHLIDERLKAKGTLKPLHVDSVDSTQWACRHLYRFDTRSLCDDVCSGLAVTMQPHPQLCSSSLIHHCSTDSDRSPTVPDESTHTLMHDTCLTLCINLCVDSAGTECDLCKILVTFASLCDRSVPRAAPQAMLEEASPYTPIGVDTLICRRRLYVGTPYTASRIAWLSESDKPLSERERFSDGCESPARSNWLPS